MTVKTGLDKFIEQNSAKKTLYNIELKINDLSNLVTNNTVFDARFENAVVQFHMFLERVKEDTLKSLVKDLHNLNFHNYVNQESYVDHLKRIYDNYVAENKTDKFKEASQKTKNTQTQKIQKVLKEGKQI